MLVDTHIHLDLRDFSQDYKAVIDRAKEAGFGRLINVGIQAKSVAASLKLAEKHEEIYFTVGVHPHDAKDITAQDWLFLEKAALHPKAVAIGEVGLDFYRNLSPQEQQKKVFRQFLQLAKKLNKPVVIHSRDAFNETIKILKEEGLSERKGVMHCFNGSYQNFLTCQELGLSISLGGTLTYPKNETLRELVKKIPLESLLLETDAPYLAPQSKRGERNEPAYLKEVIKLIATLRGLTEADIERITTANAIRLFTLGMKLPEEVIVYPIRNSLYLNLTAKCTNNCYFCVRFGKNLLRGYDLQLHHEPTVEEIIAALGDLPAKYQEVVFCGLGEPTIRLDELLTIARYLKEKFKKPIRINTNGHFYLLHNKDRLQELKGLIDALSISFNTADSKQYNQICRPQFTGEVLKEIIAFTKDAKAVIPNITITALNLPEVKIPEVVKLAKELQVSYRQRYLNEAG